MEQKRQIKKSQSCSAAAKSHQSCLTLCDPIDGSPPGSRPQDSPGKNSGVGCHFLLQCMKVKSESEVAQQCPTLCDPMDCSAPGSSIHGIFQARVLEWVAIAQSCPILGDTMDVTCQAPLFMGILRQEYQSELPCPPQGDLPYPGIKPRSVALGADSLLSEPPGKPRRGDGRCILKLKARINQEEKTILKRRDGAIMS